MQQLNLNSLFAIEPSKRGMAYQATCAARHHSVLSGINYDSCICLSHSFLIYVVCKKEKGGSTSEEKGVNGGMKKLVERWPKREELLRNGFREEIGLPMKDTGHREWL